MQNAIVELIVRIIPLKLRAYNALEWCRGDATAARLFSSISYEEFDKVNVVSQSTCIHFCFQSLLNLQTSHRLFDGF